MIETIGLLSIAILIVAFTSVMRRRNLNKRLEQFRDDWGSLSDSPIDIEDAKIFFELERPDSREQGYCIDDDSWRDLDFDDIFALINRTTTPTGAQCLFRLLRHPVDNEAILDEREKLINHFSGNQNLREHVQLAIQGLESINTRNIPNLLWKPLPQKPFWAKYLPLQSLVAMIVLGLVLSGILPFGVLLALFFVNFVTRVWVKRRIDLYLRSFEYLGDLITAAQKLSLLKHEEIGELRKTLRVNLKKTRSIEKILFAIQYEDSLAIMDYLNSYFLWDISGFYSALNKVSQHVEELKNLYRTVGYLDAMIAVASYRSEYPEYCRPSFTTESGKYAVDGIYNPLLRKPVPNSFVFDTPNYIVTGSNMAGKTTFIKTMGVNAILAQTINTCLAKKYEAPLIRVISSISPEDDLLLGKSYFMAEVESILRLIKASENDIVHLLIVDEIFRGTNSVERQAMSVEVLRYLANRNDFVLVATHDLKLSEMVGQKYQNIHFQEEVGEDGLIFDYKLRPGSSTTRNAIALLQHVGYPESITKRAMGRVRDS